MNTLTDVCLNNPNINCGTTTGQNISASNQIGSVISNSTYTGSIMLDDTSTLMYKDRAITAKELFWKLEILDRIIKEQYPEEILKG